jgi:WD40 repeat protein
LKDAHVEAISALVFTRDGKRLLSGNGPRRKPDTAGVESGYNSDVKVWDVARGTQVDVLVGHPTFGIQALGMTGDGRTAVSAGANNDKTLRLWDLAALDAPPRPFGGGKARAKGLDLTRDGQWLITHPGHKQLVFWDARTGKLLKQIETAVSLHSFVVSADKKYLYGQSIQRSIVKIDLETGKIMMSIPTGDYVPGEIVLSPDGRLMAAGSAGAQVRVIDLQTDQVLFQLKGGLDSKVHSVKFTPGSDRIAAGSSSPLIRLWDAVKGSVAHEVKLPSPPKVMTLSPDGKSVLVGFNAWPLRLFDVKRGEEIRRYEGPTLGTAVLSLAYSPDGKRILAGGPNLTLEKSRRSLVDCLHLIDVDSGRILGRWKSEPGAITNLRFSIDGNQAYYVSGGILRVLSLKEGF